MNAVPYHRYGIDRPVSLTTAERAGWRVISFGRATDVAQVDTHRIQSPARLGEANVTHHVAGAAWVA